jgi:hydroxyethylthiazole kinase
MNITANALISIGASPVMTHATEEMKDMIALTSALLINIISLSKK